MKIIYLIRHSGPFIEIDNYKNYGDVLWKEYNRNMILTSEGEKKAKKLCEVEELSDVDEIYASDSFRAIGTAKYVAELNQLPIKLDARINEREFGVDYLKELPDQFTKQSFDDKKFKINDGESLNEIDSRFTSFIDEVLNSNSCKIVVTLHGIILLSYLKKICDHFGYDGKNFDIQFQNRVVLRGTLKNPDIYKIVYDDNKIVLDVEHLKICEK